MKNKILTSTIISVFILIFGGSLLHFAYQWSGYCPWVGMFSAVNESVWEHLKLGFGALLFFSLFEYWLIRNKVKNYFIAKAAGLISMEIFIVLFFYGYTLLTEEILLLDIFSYLAGCIICQAVVYKIYIKAKLPSWINVISIIILLVFTAAMVVFTFYPPKLGIFKEQHSGNYGTQWYYAGEDPDEH